MTTPSRPGALPGARTGLSDAAAQFLSTAAAFDGRAWDYWVTDRWSERQLSAHTVRAISVLSRRCAADVGVKGPELADAPD